MHTKYDAFAANLFTVSYIKLKITRFLSVGLFWLCVFFVVRIALEEVTLLSAHLFLKMYDGPQIGKTKIPSCVK